MKYKIDSELSKIAGLKVPGQIKLFPLMNAVIGLSTCRSDDKVQVRKHTTPGYRGAELETLVIEPRGSDETMPCLVFFHGGGFLLKASHAHYEIAKLYAERVPCKVVYPDYRLAPKHPFPIPAEDCCQTYRWALDHAAALRIDPDQIIMGGDSAGGNLALAVTLMARDRNIPAPKGLMLIYPVTDRRMNTASARRYTDTPVWNTKLSKMMWKAYLGGRPPEKVEYASPMEAESLEGFPPTYIEVAQFDSLHDDGVSFYERLRDQKIEAELHEISGACHGFETALRSNLLRTCLDRRVNWLKGILNRPLPAEKAVTQ